MKKFSNLLVTAFSAPPASAGRSDDATRERRVEIVRNRAHGNIRLQKGRWYTRGDVNDWRESFRNYSFSTQ